MNAGRAAHGMRAMERLTSSMAFRVAVGTAVLFVVPVLLLGLGVSPLMLAFASPPEAIPPLLLTAAGVAGVVGWFRAGARRASPELTLTCLALGFAAALAPAGFAALTWVAADLAESWVWIVTLVAAAHLVMAVAAIGWMQRVVRLHRERTGERFDALPLVFLLLALALAIGATLVTARLAVTP